MPQVNTVLSPIDSSEMGFTLNHENITLGAAGAAATYPDFQHRQTIAGAAPRPFPKPMSAASALSSMWLPSTLAATSP